MNNYGSAGRERGTGRHSLFIGGVWEIFGGGIPTGFKGLDFVYILAFVLEVYNPLCSPVGA